VYFSKFIAQLPRPMIAPVEKRVPGGGPPEAYIGFLIAV
jgi:hypothetical protein